MELMLYPMFTMVLLACFVMVYMLSSRIQAVKKKELSVKYFKTYDGSQFPVPEKILRTSRHYSNLFEVPILYYVVCLLFIIFKKVDSLSLILAWSFALSRVWHSVIHLGRNSILWRMRAFSVSVVINLILWVYLLIKTV